MTVEPPVSYYIGCMVTCTDDNYASIDGFTVNYAIDTKGYTDAKFGEIVAPLEQYSYALRAYAAGEMFIKDDKLYRAKTSIAQFANFVVGTNCEETTVSGATVHDVQVNGTSILNQGVANVPIGGPSTLGVVKSATNNDYGIAIHSNGILTLTSAGSVRVKNGTSSTTPITPSIQHEAAFYGLAKVAGADMKDSSNSVGEYTETAKSKISDMLNAPVSVSGTTPTITAMAGVRYVCGEVSTLSVTVPESGIVDVTFTSGSTATVLTVTSAKTGVTAIKWANGFDDTSLEANTVYEINIMDGEYGVAAAWT